MYIANNERAAKLLETREFERQIQIFCQHYHVFEWLRIKTIVVNESVH